MLMLLYAPVITYNTGTWVLTQAESAHLDSFHLIQLKQLLEIRWPQCTPNKLFNQHCYCEPVSAIKTIEVQWRLFGHLLRIP